MGEIQQSNPRPLCVSSLGRNHSANVPTQRFTGAGYAAGHGELRPQPGLRLQEGNKQRSLTTVQRRHYHFQNGGKTERRTVLLYSGFRLQSGVDQQKKDCSFFQCSGAGTDRSWHRPEQNFFGWSRNVFSAGAGAKMLVNSGCYFLKKELVAFQTFFTKLADTSRFEVSHISACPNFDFLQDFLKLSMFVMIF